MAVRYDLIVDSDLVFENGDLAIKESDKHHVKDTILASDGWWKEFPTDGVNIRKYSNAPAELEKLRAKMKKQLESDGYKVENQIFKLNPDGTLTIYPNAVIF